MRKVLVGTIALLCAGLLLAAAALAAINTTASSIQYNGDGSTPTFSYPYAFFCPNPATNSGCGASSDLVVSLTVAATGAADSPAPVLNGGGTYGYTVTCISAYSAGTNNVIECASATLTFNTAPPGTDRLTIARSVAATQNLNQLDNSKFPASSNNAAFDRLTMLVQQALTKLGLALAAPGTDPAGLTMTLPPAATRANNLLGFDSQGQPIAEAIPGVGTITLSGDVAGSGSTSIPTTLATVNSNVGTFANPTLTVNGKGLVTAVSNGSGNRTKLTTATTFYVATTGTDTAGCGLTIGSPCHTRQFIGNFLQNGYDLAGQTVTIQLAHGTYTDGFGFNGALVGQTSAGQLIFTGDCSAGNTAAVMIQPTTQVNSYAFAFGAMATVQCQKVDHSKILSLFGGADMFSIGQGARVTFGNASLFGVRPDLTFGCNVNQWNAISAAFQVYLLFVNDFNIDTSSCAVTTTGTASSGSSSLTSLASTTGIVQYMGIAGTDVPADAYVIGISTGTVTMACVYTSPCVATGSGSGITFVFAGGGQVFLDLGNMAQVYFNTNGDPSYSIIANIVTYAFYISGMVFDNDLSGANAGGITWVNSGLAHGACITVEGLSVFTSYLEGTPYLPCNADQPTAQTTASSVTAGSQNIAVASAAGFVVGDILSDVVVGSATFTPGSNITVASGTGILPGAQIIGAGVLSGASVAGIVGTAVTPGGCGVGPRCVLNKPTYLSETTSPLYFKNACIPSGAVIVGISGTNIGISKPITQNCSSIAVWASGRAKENSIYQ